MPKLIVMTHPGKTKLVPLLAPDTRIGRANSNELVLDSERVSRLHATVTVGEAFTSITDHKSRNGTLVNGQRIESQVLMNGDTIVIGDCQMRFLTGEQEVTPVEALRLMTIPGLLVDLDAPHASPSEQTVPGTGTR